MTGQETESNDRSANNTPPSYTLYIRFRPTEPQSSGRLQHLKLTLDDREFYPYVKRWLYLIANRRRFTSATRDELSKSVHLWFCDKSGLPADKFKARLELMATADLVEVSIPYTSEEIGWAARVFPWESALSLLTAPHREKGRAFTVLRHLDRSSAGKLHVGSINHVLAVNSGPGDLMIIYELARETSMVEDTFGEDRVTVEHDPSRDRLQSFIRKRSPAIIHLAGVDPLALQSNGLDTIQTDQSDGFVLADGNNGFDCVSPGDLAQIVNSGETKPALVAIGCCYSAQRLAPLAVAEGALHAIGFVDAISDADAMQFFSTFYRLWNHDPDDILTAFEQAQYEWASSVAGASAEGVGVVLWSAGPFLDRAKPNAAERKRKLEDRVAGDDAAEVANLLLQIDLVKDNKLLSGVTKTRGTSLNYSLLHNNRSPFEIFTIEKIEHGKLPRLEVEVVLEVGSESCRCRFSVEWPEKSHKHDLRDRIQLPLVAGQLRQASESLRSNLYTKITCGDTVLHETSERVSVLPADEWRDDGKDHRWLPSFVLPRDPAVLEVIQKAQRYLRTLLDDCTAGFDGYQQVLEDQTNAEAVVDPQVQAIWAALQHDLPLNYINPPPSYTSQSQRLRTPTEIFKGNAATCIDLALLFSSCLEFVGIYPAIFLTVGHAFPAYWRSETAWWDMKEMKDLKFDKRFEPRDNELGEFGTENPSQMPSATATANSDAESWMFVGTDNLRELLGYMQMGKLVPFESTSVALGKSFFGSLEEGLSNLHPQNFDAMIDVQSARTENVTPLPLLDRLR